MKVFDFVCRKLWRCHVFVSALFVLCLPVTSQTELLKWNFNNAGEHSLVSVYNHPGVVPSSMSFGENISYDFGNKILNLKDWSVSSKPVNGEYVEIELNPISGKCIDIDQVIVTLERVGRKSPKHFQWKLFDGDAGDDIWQNNP